MVRFRYIIADGGARVKKQIAKERELSVVKSNDLIQKTRYNLSAQEQKIVMRIIQMIQPGDEDFKWYSFSVTEFCALCGTAPSGKNYNDIKKTILDIESKKWHMPNKSGVGEVSTAWIGKSKISPGDGTIKVRLDEDLKPYLLEIKEYFTKYSMYYTIAMRSKYSIRLYEIFKSYENLGVKAFNVKELQKQLAAEVYERWQDFRRHVIEVAVKEINLLSDLFVTYELEKTGRQYTDIVFRIKFKTDIGERMDAWAAIEHRLDRSQVKGQLNMAMQSVMQEEGRDLNA